MQPMEDSDDDLPLAKRKKPAVKRKVESGDESDDEPLSKKKAKGAFKREPSFDPFQGEEEGVERREENPKGEREEGESERNRGRKKNPEREGEVELFVEKA